jgi:hypothetical protein
MAKPTTNERIRLNLAITPTVHDRLQRLREISESETITEVVRRAMAVYDLVLTHVSAGGDVILRHPDGREETVRIIT